VIDPAHPVVNQVNRSRYEVLANGSVAGFADYKLRMDGVLFIHSEISEDYGGQELGDILARRALEDARTRGLTIVPICPLIARWLRRNPTFDGLVDWEAAEQQVNSAEANGTVGEEPQ
jgi:predicted GNAT family acetyltransferase